MGVHLRVYDDDGTTVLGFAPDFFDLECADLWGEPGALSFGYPRTGINAHLLAAADRTVGLWLDGGEKLRVVLDVDGRDEADPKAPLAVSGATTLSLLSRARVYPQGGPGTRPFSWAFTNATPGTVIGTLVAAAQARGTIPMVTAASFDAVHDSLGGAWPGTVTRTYPAGEMTVLDVLMRLVEEGHCDVRMVGVDLRLYRRLAGPVRNPGGYAQDRPGVVLRRGRDLLAAPRERDMGRVTTAVLLSNDYGFNGEFTDAAAIAAYGRREGYEGAGGAVPEDLPAIAGRLLADNVEPDAGHATLALTEVSPRPWTGYFTGDTIRMDREDGTVGAVFVSSIAAKLDRDGLRTAEIEWNRAARDPVIGQERRVARVGGTIPLGQHGPLPRLGPAAWSRGEITDDTDAGGYVTWPHGLGTTPAVVTVEPEAPIGGVANLPAQHITDTYGPVTCRTRFFTQGGAAYASAPVTFRYRAEA